MASTNSTVSDLYCPKCQKRYPVEEVVAVCRCGRPLLVDYIYPLAAQRISRSVLMTRSRSMWRYREMLPVRDDQNIVSLEEGGTSLLKARRVGREIGLGNLFFKDESTNPTGSFKARGLSMAVSRAKELGLSKLIIPTAGNAGTALAAYCAAAGLECRVVMPEGTPSAFAMDCRMHGASVEIAGSSIREAGERVSELARANGWFPVSTLKEPYRIEGKKTMGYELYEQFEGALPDVIVYPTGGGTGLIGMWKAFGELERLGWNSSPKPKMVAVQVEGCAPIVKAFELGDDHAQPWPNPTTLAHGLRVPSAIGDFLILKAIRDSGGTAVAVSEREMLEGTRMLSAKEGILAAPEGGAALAGAMKLAGQGVIGGQEKVVVFVTGSGEKYLKELEASL